MSAGKEFQTDGAATEKARRASSVRVRGRLAVERPMNAESELESALCGDANPRRLQRQSCCG